MEDSKHPKKSFVQSTEKEFSMTEWLAVIRNLRSASDPIISHAKLHGKLLGVELAEARMKLRSMLLISVVGFAAFICFLLCSGLIVLTLGWDTQYRMAVILTLNAVYGFMACIAWWRLTKLTQAANEIFDGTRSEIAADIALFRSKIF